MILYYVLTSKNAFLSQIFGSNMESRKLTFKPVFLNDTKLCQTTYLLNVYWTEIRKDVQFRGAAQFSSKAEIKGFLFFLKAHFFEFLSNK